VEEHVELRIYRLVDRRRHRPAVDRRGRRDGHLRRALCVLLEEFEMLEHRMAGKAELAADAHALIARGHSGKGDAAVHLVALDAVAAPEKVEMPPGAAELAVGDGLQAGLLLLGDDRADLAVFHFLQRIGGDLAVGAALARFLQGAGTQEAADMIGAERRLGALHSFSFLFPLPLAVVVSQRGSRRAQAANVIAKPRRPIRRSCAASPTAPPPTK